MKTRRTQSLLLAAFTIVCGLVWRLAPLHLPAFLFKYGGSVLYAIMIYWLLAAVIRRGLRLTVAAIVTVTTIEFFKLVRTPALDAFRLTLPGKLILGRIFSISDLGAYTLAIVAVASVDNYQRIKGSKLE